MNRERIKSALILSLKEKTREECKNCRVTRAKTEELLITKAKEFERASEYLLDQYDKYLFDTLATSFSTKLKESVEKDNELFNAHFQNIVNTLNNNHIQVSNNFSNLSAYHMLIREKILEEEVLHLQEDCELLEQHKKALNRLALKAANKISWLFVSIAFASVVIWCGLIYMYGWDKMEQWTWISALILTFLNGVYFVIWERDFTRDNIRKNKQKKAIEYIYSLYKFDEKQINRYMKLLKLKRNEINQIKEEKQSNSSGGGGQNPCDPDNRAKHALYGAGAYSLLREYTSKHFPHQITVNSSRTYLYMK